MHRQVDRLIVFGFAILLPYASALAQQTQSAGPPNRKAIVAVVQELDAAWNARDSARFSAVFSEDGSFGFPIEGITLRGRGEIKGYYDKVFARMPPDLRHVTRIRDFEVINPNLVGVEVEVNIFGTDSTTGTAQITLAHYGGLGLGVRTDSGWRIRLGRVYEITK